MHQCELVPLFRVARLEWGISLIYCNLETFCILIMSVFRFMDNRQNDSNLILREKSNGHKSNPVEVKENGLMNFQTFGFLPQWF